MDKTRLPKRSKSRIRKSITLFKENSYFYHNVEYIVLQISSVRLPKKPDYPVITNFQLDCERYLKSSFQQLLMVIQVVLVPKNTL